MLPLTTLRGRGFCPRQGSSHCHTNITTPVSGSFTAACSTCQATANPTPSSSVSDVLDNGTLAEHKLNRRQLSLAAAVAAASQWLALPQPAAARSASSQKVDPQLLAAFQEALSAKSYEVGTTGLWNIHSRAPGVSVLCNPTACACQTGVRAGRRDTLAALECRTLDASVGGH